MVIEEEKVLSSLDDYYSVDQFGSVIGENGEELESIVRDGVRYVVLDWYDGLREYEQGLVVVVATRNIQIPKSSFGKIKVLYADGDRTNVFPGNLCYKFSEKIKIDGHPEYYYIPYYTRYGISIDGSLICLRYLKIKKWIVTSRKNKNNRKGGYLVAVAHHDYKGHRHISRHRAIGMTFLDYDKSILDLVINHKDGVPGNDIPSNLEWVTKGENNQHAYDNNLFSNKTTSVLVMDWRTGHTTKYNSIMQCARAIGKTEGFVHVRARKPDTRYSDGLVMKIDDGTPWPNFKDEIATAISGIDILARNIYTGEIFILDGPLQAEQYTGVKRATITYHCDTDAIVPVNGYNFRYHIDSIKWPNHSKKHLLIYRKYPIGKRSAGVIVSDRFGNELAFYESLKDAAAALKLNLITLTGRIAKGSVIDGKTFSSYKLEENLGPDIE